MIKTIAHLADIHIRKLRRFVEYREVFNRLYIKLKHKIIQRDVQKRALISDRFVLVIAKNTLQCAFNAHWRAYHPRVVKGQ